MKAKDTEKSFEERWIEDDSYALGKKAGHKEVVDRLGVFENDMGFCEISNHVPYQELKEWGL